MSLARFRSLSRTAQIAVGAGTLIAVCACCALGIAAVSNSGTSAPTGNSAPTATGAPGLPTATPKPKTWVTVQHWSGSQNLQTPTFHVSDGDRIVWVDTPTDTSANLFSVELDAAADGSPIDLVANTANDASRQTSIYTVHGNADVYLKVTALSVQYDITVQEQR